LDAIHPEQFSKSDYSQLLEVIDASDEGLLLLDAEMRLMAWNRRLSEITGKKSEEALGHHVEGILPRLASPQFIDQVRSVVNQQMSKDGAMLVRPVGLGHTLQFFKNDNNLFTRVSVWPLMKHPGHCLVQICDVDAETELQEQARRYRLAERRSLAMLSAIEDAVILLDMCGCIEFANLAAQGMTGYHSSEMVGRPLTDFYRVFSESGDTGILLVYEQIIALDGYPLQLIHRKGHDLSIEQSLKHLMNERGGIEGVVLVFKDVSQTRKLAAQLNWQMSHDPITRLYNRAEFDRSLSRLLLEEAEVEESEHCLLYLDIDRFNVINDTFGHVAGDELLRQVGLLIKRGIRSSDLLARVGDDEFAILLGNCSLEAAQHIADAIRIVFKRNQFTWDGKTFSLSVSIGLVSIDKEIAGTQDVLSIADSACYAAKEAGRNQIHVYRPDSDVVALRYGLAQWVSRIRSALEEDRFILYVQPIRGVSANCKSQQHYEVLIRMIDESGSLIQPETFIPVAERYDLMPAIDRWVVCQLIDRLAVRNSGFDMDQRLFVNLSGQSLCDKVTLHTIVDKIRRYDIPRGLLCFEVTETAAIASLSSAKQFMHTLKRFGCEFALDDFGSGLSSFNYLKHMPVRYLKIDGGFIKEMGSDSVDESMVDAINRIGHIMGLETIAECVESEDLLHRLIAMGVDYVQGYGICRPFPIDDLFSSVGCKLA
jgi:diguanylate cyclase (GGDEF)-like protein/PAS domain S-box-containing protein